MFYWLMYLFYALFNLILPGGVAVLLHPHGIFVVNPFNENILISN